MVFHYYSIIVIKTAEFVNLDQKSYLKKILLQYRFDICQPISLQIYPGIFNYILPVSKNQQVDKIFIFWDKAIIGLFIYIITMIYLDIWYKLSIFTSYYINYNSTYIMAIV